MAIFGILRENLAKFYQHGDFELVLVLKWEFFYFEKNQKFYSEILRNFSKNFSDLKVHTSKIFENSFLRMQ